MTKERKKRNNTKMKTTMTKPISPRQLQALQISLRAIGLTDKDERHDYISSQIGRRVASTKELTFEEANRLLSSLSGGNDRKSEHLMREEARRLVGRIYGLSFRISFLNKGYSGNNTPEDYEMNKAKINVWVRKYSGTGKNLTQMDVEELRKVYNAMRKIVRKEEEAEP